MAKLMQSFFSSVFIFNTKSVATLEQELKCKFYVRKGSDFCLLIAITYNMSRTPCLAHIEILPNDINLQWLLKIFIKIGPSKCQKQKKNRVKPKTPCSCWISYSSTDWTLSALLNSCMRKQRRKVRKLDQFNWGSELSEENWLYVDNEMALFV